MTFSLFLFSLFALLSLPRLRRRPGLHTARERAAVASGLFFLVAGALHFLRPAMYDAMVPPFLPAPRLWTLLSGAAQVAGGLGMLAPRWRRPAGAFLVALLFAILPANVYVAVAGLPVGELPLPGPYRWVRLPYQLVYVAWVAWAAGLLPLRARARRGGGAPPLPSSAAPR